MWWKWFPWRFVIRNAARRQGFLDPVKILSQLQNFSQPSEVLAPTELLRSGVVLHARGLLNSLAIQHNLDWIWPYWVECQYDPQNAAFIPRAFSLTQINLTHRNWTAVGIPDISEYPIVDPRGLVTPLYDGWSIDAWILPFEGSPLFPSRLPIVSQKLIIDKNLCVATESSLDKLKIRSEVQVINSAQSPVCQIKITGFSPSKAWLVISLRPYNPEGVSFIHDIALLDNRLGFSVNRKDFVYLDKPPDQCEFSYYHHGDVYSRLPSQEDKKEVICKVGMATAAAMYKLEGGESKEITVTVPLGSHRVQGEPVVREQTAPMAWSQSLEGKCSLQIPDERFQFLYESAIRTMVLHSPKEVYPGPFIYRRFWFRDAAYILYALLSVGLEGRVKRALDCFRHRQTNQGYFLSQDGEWDSNGEALWIMQQYCAMTASAPPQEWKTSIDKAGEWIIKKRLSPDSEFKHAGLLPAGFSAEHLGPNDFYYWDDFWAVAGLKAAGSFSKSYGDIQKSQKFFKEAEELSKCIDRSLSAAEKRINRPAMPASPYRRLDAGAIGSIPAGYPLQLFAKDDPRLLDTVEFLLENCMIEGGFFHDMTHSGINPYLTLHLAQVLLRAGDSRYFDLMSAIAGLASPTGQWPEAIHPRTGGGCMGDGQHVWAAAEWVLMIRNCFVREENEGLILCSGIPQSWLDKKQTICFGPAPTKFGDVQISIKPQGQSILVEWRGQWFTREPAIDIQLPGFTNVRVLPATSSLELKYERNQ